MKKIVYSISILSVFIFSSCKKETEKETPLPTIQVPATYSFSDVDFSGQITRQDMLTAMANYIKPSNDGTVALDSIKLLNMYSGTGFDNAALNTSGKQLSNKTASIFKEKMLNFLKELAHTSKLNRPGSKGISGTVTSPVRKVLVDGKGFEFTQAFQKGIMSSVFMEQALNNYLANILLDDNTSATYKPGLGTDMAHHWDEAYGYFTDSKNFPTEGVSRFWGDYSDGVNLFISSNAALGLAFRTGRQAIVENNKTIVKTQAEIIKAEWTKVAAANAIHYINDAKKDFGDNAVKFHELSECYGFVIGIQIGGGSVAESILKTFEQTGFYDISEVQLTEISNKISTEFKLKSVESSL